MVGLPNPRQNESQGKGERWYHKALRLLDYVVGLIGGAGGFQ